MAIVKAERFTALKAKVKAEMLRRDQSGSVAAYGGSAYDYTEPPAAGKTIRQEHRDKLAGPMSAVNSRDIPATSGAKPVTEAEVSAMETKIAVWAARPITDNSGSDCRSGCTGTCYTGCNTGCSGCGSGCPTGCSGCGSGCPTGCSGCGSGCPTGCSGCGSGCPAGCSTGCVSYCAGACAQGCAIDCGSGCSSACSSCGGNCSGYASG